MAEKIIVTGGAGFIGANLIRRLNELGEDRILVVDSMGKDDKWRNLSGAVFRDYWEKEDFIDMVSRQGLPPEVDTVFHLGACSSTTEKDLGYLIRNNYFYSRELARACLARGTRLVYASSAATYGAGNQGYDDDHGKLESLRPLNGYGFSKQLFDLWAWRNGFLERFAGIKYFNVYGPFEAHKKDMRSMVCKGFEQIRATGKLRLFASDRPEYPDGGQKRDFIYVKDAVEMTLFFMRGEEGGSKGGIFNAGTGQANTWNSLGSAIFSALDLKEDIEYIPMPLELAGRYQYHTQAKMEKLNSSGYNHPLTSLKDAVADYVQNYLLSED